MIFNKTKDISVTNTSVNTDGEEPRVIESRKPITFKLRNKSGKVVRELKPNTSYGAGQNYASYIAKLFNQKLPEEDVEKELSFFFEQKDINYMMEMDRRQIKWILNEILIWMGFGEESDQVTALQEMFENLGDKDLEEMIANLKSK